MFCDTITYYFWWLQSRKIITKTKIVNYKKYSPQIVSQIDTKKRDDYFLVTFDHVWSIISAQE